MLKLITQQFVHTKKYSYFFLIVILCNSSVTYADSILTKHQTSNTYQAYVLPNTTNTSLNELYQLKTKYESTLQSLNITNSDLVKNDELFLQSLIAYDDIRLNISDVIVKLVDKYNVDGEYKMKLLGYSDTFNSKIKKARKSVNTLEEYKTYSTHFSVVYISLLYTFKENEAFYTQYRQDIYKPSSILGKYQHELSISYKEVEKAHKNFQLALHANNLKNIITQLNNVINARNIELSAHSDIDLHL